MQPSVHCWFVENDESAGLAFFPPHLHICFWVVVFFFRYACPYLTERVELEIYQLILAQFRQLNQQIASLIYCILFELTVMLI